jgi:hypothetical protein
MSVAAEGTAGARGARASGGVTGRSRAAEAEVTAEATSAGHPNMSVAAEGTAGARGARARGGVTGSSRGVEPEMTPEATSAATPAANWWHTEGECCPRRRGARRGSAAHVGGDANGAAHARRDDPRVDARPC